MVIGHCWVAIIKSVFDICLTSLIDKGAFSLMQRKTVFFSFKSSVWSPFVRKNNNHCDQLARV